MSTPEALLAYERDHARDIADVLAQLRDPQRQIPEEEVDRARQLMEIRSTAAIHGAGFIITRDIDDHYVVRFGQDEARKAA